MGKLEDLINSLESNEDGTGLMYPDDFVDRIKASAAEDAAAVAAAADAKIQTLEDTVKGLNNEITATKAHNYELMRAVPNTDVVTDDDDDSDDEPRGVDSLFTTD